MCVSCVFKFRFPPSSGDDQVFAPRKSSVQLCSLEATGVPDFDTDVFATTEDLEGPRMKVWINGKSPESTLRDQSRNISTVATKCCDRVRPLRVESTWDHFHLQDQNWRLTWCSRYLRHLPRPR